MAINLEIYSNSNSSSKTISVDFFIDIMADPLYAPTTESTYYLKFTTGATDVTNKAYPTRFAKGLDSLVLNGNAQTDGSASDYSDIDALIKDYVYDYIVGHAANVYSSGVAYKAPMKFK